MSSQLSEEELNILRKVRKKAGKRKNLWYMRDIAVE